ncbi:MAG: tyrosine-protein phosphatase [Alphaproteobacteria bacterium]|jgi:protein-tyrosine phosphatase|nr:tyrosine-protein phosphatase [Alphaproteobacteria bacterium]MDP6588251.1 tyrosine-protein phosphatase [Alphaproteobacteria bacterium]MDP6818848.1 tyrosine-protein phosphatase [Alphaproteobacteria bacterium]
MTTETVPAPAGQRHIPFAGAVNFRDLGGYPDSEGQRTAWGRVYRSDSLAELSDSDHETWRRLGIRLVCDLRLPSERRNAPDRLPQYDGLRERSIGFLPHGASEMLRAVRARELDSGQIVDEVTRHYRRLPLDHLSEYRQIFSLLAEPQNRPLVVHCTSGKDRTGFAAMLILLALGVSEELARQDYLLTNSYRREVSHIFDLDIGAAEMQTLTSARPEYFDAALEAMHGAYGSTLGYLEGGIGLDDAGLACLREALLEPL